MAISFGVPATTRRFIAAFLFRSPVKVATMTLLLAAAALLEGLGTLTLLPIFEAAARADAPSDISIGLGRALAWLGLPDRLPVLLGLLVGAFVLKALVYFLAMQRVGWMVADLGHRLRLATMDSLLEARWSHMAQTQPGHFAVALSSEAERASWGVIGFCNALSQGLQILVYLGLIVVISPTAAVAMPIAVAAALLALSPVVSAGRAAGNRSTRHMRALVDRLSELLPGLKAIRAMGLERESRPLLIQEAKGFRDAQRWTVTLQETIGAIYDIIAAALLALALWAGLVLAGMGIGTLMLLAVFFQRMMAATSKMQSDLQGMLLHESAFNAIDDMIAGATAAREPMGVDGAATPTLSSAIALVDIGFSHPGRAVLEGLEGHIPAHRMTVLAGASGAGKTTLVDLLIGLSLPDRGRIEIDGTPLGPANLRAWRRVCGYLPQEPLLFRDTIRRNLTLGAEGVSDADLMRACRITEIADVVAQAGGLDAPLSGYGGALSGGQRQRLCLARALARRPQLLILDEATSALDPETSRRVSANLRGILDETTILAVTHDPILRAAADTVLHLKEGRLVAETAAPV